MHLSASLLARVSSSATAFAATLLLGASITHAADQLVLGKKLLIKNRPLAPPATKWCI